MLQLSVEFTARFEAKIELPDDYTEDELATAIADIDIPENGQCEYCFASFKVDPEKIRIVRELKLSNKTLKNLSDNHKPDESWYKENLDDL